MKVVFLVVALAVLASVSAQNSGGPVSAGLSSAASDPLEKIIIPRVDFRESTLEEAVEYLVTKSKAVDPSGKGDCVIEDEQLRKVRVTFAAKAVPLSAVIRYCALLADCDVHKQASTYFLVPRNAKPAAGRVPGLTAAKRSRSALVKATGINVPKIDFRESTFRDVIEFLAAKSVHLDPKGEGVSIVLKPGANMEALRVNQIMESISLADALGIIAKEAGYEIVDDDYALIIRPRKK